MKIEIRKRGEKTAILISFDMNSARFSSTEKNRFFTQLYGRNQIVKNKQKVYEYHREGLMDEIPHIKVDNSVFIIAMQHMQEMMNFFNEWENKVVVKSFPVLLDDKESKEIEIE